MNFCICTSSYRKLKSEGARDCRLSSPVTHHINFVLVHHDASAQQEGEHEFVLLEQAAAHVAVQAEGEELIDVVDSLLHRVCEKEKISLMELLLFC